MKRNVSFLLIIVLITQLFIGINFTDDDDGKVANYIDNLNVFDFATDVPKVTNGTAYRTIGFKATLVQNGHPYDAYIKMEQYKERDHTGLDGKPWIETKFHVPVSKDNRIKSENIVSVYDTFKSKYQNDPTAVKEISEFFAADNSSMRLDAVLTTVTGNNNLGGSMTVTNGEASFSGKVFKTYNEFITSGIDWSQTTRSKVLSEYYNIQLPFHAQPMIPTPKIMGTVDGVRAERSNHVFKEGQTIELDGNDSDFPSKTKPLSYKWSYKKVGSTTPIPLPIKKDGGTPFATSIEPGTYDVELKVSARYTRSWDTTDAESESTVIAKTIITIEKNLNPLANAIVTSPPEIMLEDAQNSISIPVNLNTEVLNVEQTDILSVELQLSTYEKDQKRSQFFYPSLSQIMTHNFTIPYSGDPKTQVFEGKAIVTLKGGGIIESPIARSLTYLYKANNNLPPVAIIRAPNETMAGSTYISGSSSYDLDGNIVLYDFSIPKIGFYQSDTKSFCMPDLKWTGTYQVILGVTDDDGARSETGAFIKVIPVPPNVEISSKGFYKENRKITLTATNWTEMASPVGENYHWSIKPMDVTSPQSTVKMVSTHGKQIDVLMKVKGKYLVTCTGTNTYNASDTKTMILDVKEDEAPVMVIDSTNPQFRDSTRTAKITAYDHSYSTDGDFIKSRTWSYRFDSDNDGLFTDESSIVLKSTQDYIDNVVKFDVGSVGKYEITLLATETFGQETIPSFITQADYKTGTIKQVITVDNYKPVVNFMAVNEKKIDIDVITDYEGQELLDLESKLNLTVQEGYDQFLNIQFNVISDKKYIGRYLDKEATNYNNVLDEDYPKYPVAFWNGLTEYSDHSYDVTMTTWRMYPNNITVTTNDFFPSRIKKSFQYNSYKSIIWWLENGDVYLMGTNSSTSFGNTSSSTFALKPTKIASNVVQIEGNSAGAEDRYFLLTESGEVYWLGHTVKGDEKNQYGPYFTSVNNTVNFAYTLPTEVDQCGINPNINNVHDNFSGYKSAKKIPSISNANYIWSNGMALVYRRNDGKWFGFGSGLNAFGLSTGFENQPREILTGYTGIDMYKDSVLPYLNSYYFDNQNTVTEIKNLSELDKTLGGIAKVAPNIVYASNGFKYGIKETPFKLVGGEYFPNMEDIPDDGREYEVLRYQNNYDGTIGASVYYRLQVISSKFEYHKIGTWEEPPRNERKAYVPNYTASQILEEGVDRTPYLRYIDEPVTGGQHIVSKAITQGTDIPMIADAVIKKWLSPLDSTYFDYRYLSYVKKYTYTHKIANPNITYSLQVRDGKDSDGDWEYTWQTFTGPGWDYYYDVTTADKVIQGTSPGQAGWKTYGIDASKIKTTTYRTGSNKYMLYFGKGDSFKKVSNDLETLIKTNHINVKVATKIDYVDDVSINKSSEIDLRGLVNALPTGMLYSINSDDGTAKETAIDQVLSDIIAENKIKMAPDGGTYVILGEDTISYNKFYRDIESDPKRSETSKAIHNKDYFKNSMGLSVYHNQILTLPLTTFDKVGQYEIEYKATDQPSTNYRLAQYNRTSDPATLKVYVHRRPVADFDIERDYEASLIDITLKNQSYDLDHQGEIHDGIASSEWSYKLGDQTTWQSGMPTSINYGDTLEIALTVTDLEGATSSQVKSYTMPEAIPLFLSCELKPERIEFDKNAIPASESLRLTNIIVSRVIPHGIEINLKSNDGSISQKYTEYTNSNTTTYTDANGMRTWHDILITLPATYKDGGYKVEVKLKDLKNADGTSYQLKTGDQVSKTLDFKIITPVKLNASIAAQSGNAYDLKGITGRYSKETTVKLFSGTSYEKTISLPKTSETHKTNHLLDEATWLRNVKVIATDVDTGTPAPTGRYMARFETKTASGNRAVSEVPFDYQPVIVKSFDARGYWNHWRGQTTLKGEVTTIEPHRFLSHECVIFEALIEGEIEEALLRLSPELESMTYWDKYNNVYRYEDDFYMKVYFPIHLKRVQKTAEGDLWQYEYALPYADSTQSYDNERLKPSYKATLYVIPKGVDWHGDYTTEGLIKMEIEDIDITGNIYDLLYIEPVRGNVSEMSQ